MYFIVLLLLIIFSIIDIWKGDKKNVLFHGAFLILTLMLCLRYGQGTDYYGYQINYEMTDTHSEIGYKFLSLVCGSFGLSFEVFIAIVSLFQMVCLYRGICSYSPVKTLSLLLFYPTLFLTYCFSGIRQGMVIMFFLGFMIMWLQDGKWLRYVAACLIMTTIHSAALALIPLAALKRVKIKWLYWGIVLAVGVGVFIYLVPAEVFSFIKIGAVQFYINSISISVMGLLERIVMFAILTFLFWQVSKSCANDQLTFLYKVYTCGFIISVMFFPWAMLSSRLAAAMKATEIFMFPLFLKENLKWRKTVIAFLVSYTILMTTKNIWSYMEQAGGEYHEYSIPTYPYCSVFEKRETYGGRSGDYKSYLYYVDSYKKLH